MRAKEFILWLFFVVSFQNKNHCQILDSGSILRFFFKAFFQYNIVIVIALVSAIVLEKTKGKTICVSMFLHTITAFAMIGASCFGTSAFSNIWTTHSITSFNNSAISSAFATLPAISTFWSYTKAGVVMTPYAAILLLSLIHISEPTRH